MNTVNINWPAPKHVKSYSTLRTGGVSALPFDSFNLGSHVDDNPNHVSVNRQRLQHQLNISNPLWLQQTHSDIVIDAANWQKNIEADGIFTHKKNTVCVVMTADCLPIFITDKQGSFVMSLHGGWRSLANKIIAKGIAKINTAAEDLLVWLGPAIGPEAFEVGNEVKVIFEKENPNFKSAFKPSVNQRWLMNIYHIATWQCQQLGIQNIYSDYHCTHTETDKFFSYRRDGKTGRMAHLIWIE